MEVKWGKMTEHGSLHEGPRPLYNLIKMSCGPASVYDTSKDLYTSNATQWKDHGQWQLKIAAITYDTAVKVILKNCRSWYKKHLRVYCLPSFFLFKNYLSILNSGYEMLCAFMCVSDD